MVVVSLVLVEEKIRVGGELVRNVAEVLPDVEVPAEDVITTVLEVEEDPPAPDVLLPGLEVLTPEAEVLSTEVLLPVVGVKVADEVATEVEPLTEVAVVLLVLATLDVEIPEVMLLLWWPIELSSQLLECGGGGGGGGGGLYPLVVDLELVEVAAPEEVLVDPMIRVGAELVRYEALCSRTSCPGRTRRS